MTGHCFLSRYELWEWTMGLVYYCRPIASWQAILIFAAVISNNVSSSFLSSSFFLAYSERSQSQIGCLPYKLLPHNNVAVVALVRI